MRRATQDTSFISNDNETSVLGVALGYDYCAEHEGGIKEIKANFGLDLDPQARGLDRYKVSQLPRNLTWIRGKTGKESWEGFASTPDQGLDFTRWGDQPLSSQWDSRGFAVVAWEPEGVGRLKTIFQSLEEKKAVLTQGGASSGNPFGGSGPCLMRTDTDHEEWEALDQKLRREQDEYDQWCAEWAEEAGDLYEPLLAMGSKLGVWSSSPWIYLPIPKPDGSWTYMPRGSSFHDGAKRVWLNPSHQDLFNAGWYTSEHLRQWASGDGPVWPLCVALPPGAHPFWKAVRDTAPKPDKSYPQRRWDSFNGNLGDVEAWQTIKGIGPKMAARIVSERDAGLFKDADDLRDRIEGIGKRLHQRIRHYTNYCPIDWPEKLPWDFSSEDLGYSVYYKGNGIWHSLARTWGFALKNAYRTRGARHSIFRADLAAAQEKGLTTLGYITDLVLFREQVEAWNTANPDNEVDFHIYGRGTTSLRARLEAS